MSEAKRTADMVKAGQVARFDLAKAWDALVAAKTAGLSDEEAIRTAYPAGAATPDAEARGGK